MQFLYNSLTISKACTRISDQLASIDLRAEMSFDFKRLRKLVKPISDKSLTKQFSGKHHDLHSANAFWLGVFDADDQLVSLDAFRVEDIGRHTLAEYWGEQHPRIYGGELGEINSIAATEITGLVVYHGERYTRAKANRNDILVTDIAPRLGKFLALQQWRPNFMYAFSSEKHIRRGLGIWCGYHHQEHRPVIWSKAVTDRFNSDYLVWDKASDIEREAENYAT